MSEIKPAAKGRLPADLIILSLVIILYSIQGMPPLNFNNYYIRFYPAAQRLIFLRYIVSIGIRLALFACGIGILLRREIFRKAAVFIAVFTIVTVYWKHPVSVFKKILTQQIGAGGAVAASQMLRVNMLAWICVIISSAVDIIIVCALAYLLTRPRRKEQFS